MFKLRSIRAPFLHLLILSATLAAVPASKAQAALSATTAVHPITSLPKAPRDIPPATASVTDAPTTAYAVVASSSQPPAPAYTAPAPVVMEPMPLHALVAQPTVTPRLQRDTLRPFSTVAIGVTVGVGGIGGQIATPLTQTTNLRVGASFFSYSDTFTEDGLRIAGDLKFRSVNASLDWFPFHNGFRISPGVTLYNGNNLNATVNVPGGSSFELNDVAYTSSATDPVHGTGSVTFGNRTAPSLTVGFGNMVPRSRSRHFSVPFELGIQYIGDPLISFNLTGTACNSSGCSPIATDPQSQANLRQEQNDLNSDIRPLRFYPIASIGFAYKF